MQQCERCESTVGESGGLLSKIGFGSEDGWKCPDCGTVMCEDCIKERRTNMMVDYDKCPVCGSMLEHR